MSVILPLAAQPAEPSMGSAGDAAVLAAGSASDSAPSGPVAESAAQPSSAADAAVPSLGSEGAAAVPAAGSASDSALSGPVVESATNNSVASQPAAFEPSSLDGAAAQPVALEPSSLAGTPLPSTESITQALTCRMLEGDALDKVSMGKLRRLTAESLGLPADGLDARSVDVQNIANEIVQALAGWWGPELAADHRGLEVYLITFAAVLSASVSATAASRPLRSLEGLSRADIRDAILDVFNSPPEDKRRGRKRATPISIAKMVVFEEVPKHYHVAIKLSCRAPFLIFKNALRDRHGLASHWSQSHSMFWSALRYGTTATEHKPVVDATPLIWTHDSKPLDLFAESQEPFMASVVRKRREVAAMRPDPAKVAKGASSEKFTKFDLMALIISEDLKTPAAILVYVQRHGSTAMQAFVNRQQGRLNEHIAHAHEWSAAEVTVQEESESEWTLLQRLADEACSCEGDCGWSQAAQAFFERNSQWVDEDRLAACVAAVIQGGPAKTRRVPLLVGPSNAGKSTIFDPVDSVFGAEAVFHTPAMGSPMALANLALRKKRFLYLDDYRPVEYAFSTAKKPATIPVVTFLKLAGGQSFEVQVSQSFQNGNIDLQWTKGAAITAKDEGLWQPAGNVSPEDIRHIQSRVEQFTAKEQLPIKSLRDVPMCKQSWASWVVTRSAAFAARSVPSSLPDPAAASQAAMGSANCSSAMGPRGIHGFVELMHRAVVSPGAAENLKQEMMALGVVSVQELTVEDWKSLRAWQTVLPFAQRRLLALVQ